MGRYASRDKKPVTAYEIAISHGFTGNEMEWLESLKGESAYQIAVKNGFTGSEDDFVLLIMKRDDV